MIIFRSFSGSGIISTNEKKMWKTCLFQKNKKTEYLDVLIIIKKEKKSNPIFCGKHKKLSTSFPHNVENIT